MIDDRSEPARRAIWLTEDEVIDVVSCLRYKALRILKNDRAEAERLGALSDEIQNGRRDR